MIYDYYIENAQKNGWKIDQEMRSDEIHMIHGVKDDRELAVSVGGDGTETTINMTVTGV